MGATTVWSSRSRNHSNHRGGRGSRASGGDGGCSSGNNRKIKQSVLRGSVVVEGSPLKGNSQYLAMRGRLGCRQAAPHLGPQIRCV